MVFNDFVALKHYPRSITPCYLDFILFKVLFKCRTKVILKVIFKNVAMTQAFLLECHTTGRFWLLQCLRALGFSDLYIGNGFSFKSLAAFPPSNKVKRSLDTLYPGIVFSFSAINLLLGRCFQCSPVSTRLKIFISLYPPLSIMLFDSIEYFTAASLFTIAASPVTLILCNLCLFMSSWTNHC